MNEFLLTITLWAAFAPQQGAATESALPDERPMVTVPECGTEAPCDPPPPPGAPRDDQARGAAPEERGLLHRPGVAPALASATVCGVVGLAAIAFALPTSLLSIPVAAVALVFLQPAAAATAAYLVTPEDVAAWPSMIGGAVGDLVGLVVGVAVFGIVGGGVGIVVGELSTDDSGWYGAGATLGGLFLGVSTGAVLGGFLGSALGAFLGVRAAVGPSDVEAVGAE